MFSVGIFTTHIPYVVMIVFYAWFLITGVNKTGDEKITVAEKSITIQQHINGSTDFSKVDTYAFYSSLTEINPKTKLQLSDTKQKWKQSDCVRFYTQEYFGNSLFCRPPPVVA